MSALRAVRVAILAVASSALLAASSAGQHGAADTGPSTAETVSYAPPPPPAPPAERMRLRDGLAAAEGGDWIGLAALRDNASDTLVRRMLQWRLAIAADAPLNFSDLALALDQLQGWPGRATMRTRAEQAIFDAPLSAREKATFLRQDQGPLSGDGRVALALALRDLGETAEANTLARTAWREDTLSASAEDRLLAAFSSALSTEDHAARVDILLWRGQRSAAQQLLGRLSTADRLAANARIALQARSRRGLQEAVDAVPDSRQGDPGFLYDRTQYRRRTDQPIEAMQSAALIDARQAPMAARDDIFRERRLYVPRALRSGNYQLAYNLVANHGLTSGEEFADAEWLSGWLMLRFLNQPQRAAEHFAHLDANVSSPVSSSRALYWRAEAEAALGRASEAEALRARAARFTFTYYGQLAATRGRREATISLPDTARVTEAARARFESRELVRALRLMSEVGAQRDFESIAYYLDDTLDDPMEIELLAQMAREQSYHRTALRSAKAGLFRNVIATSAAYPMIDLPSSVQTRGPEPALVFAIIRQESEFDPSAISSANARGLMQLIPSTARMQANREGMSYATASLTSDAQYNMTLGSAHLQQLVEEFNGSYVLAIASYNAGSHRAREWIADWGDPRSPSVDVVDWVELIPFGETRNYVQRVMENLQVYRHRVTGAPVQIQLESDLQRGRY